MTAKRSTKPVPVVALTRDEALRLGIVFCTCGHPPNNHFLDMASKKCARCSTCTGYVEGFSMGMPIEPPKRLRGPTREVRMTMSQIEYLIAEMESVLEVCETPQFRRSAQACLTALTRARDKG